MVADDNIKADTSDRSKLAAGQEPEVGHLAGAGTTKQARDLVCQHDSNRQALMEESDVAKAAPQPHSQPVDWKKFEIIYLMERTGISLIQATSIVEIYASALTSARDECQCFDKSATQG